MTFHFWRTEAVVADLSTERVTELDAMKYAMANSLLVAEGVYWSMWVGGYRDWVLLFEFLTVCAITAFGMHECYRANGGAEGRNFLRNFFCVSWPVTLKVAIGSTLFGLALFYGFPRIAGRGMFRDPGFAYSVISFFATCLWAFGFYWRVAVHLAALRRFSSSNISVNADVRERAFVQDPASSTPSSQ